MKCIETVKISVEDRTICGNNVNAENVLDQFTHKNNIRAVNIDLEIRCSFKEDQDHLFLELIKKEINKSA